MKSLTKETCMAPLRQSIVVTILSCSMFFHSSVIAQASANGSEYADCLYDDGFSKALGTLIFGEVIKPYLDSINPDVFFSALGEYYKRPENGERLNVDLQSLTSADSVENPQTLAESISEAEKIVGSWASRNTSFNEENDLTTHYKRRYLPKQTTLGVLFREVYSKTTADAGNFMNSCLDIRKAHSNYANGTMVNENWVCTQKQVIDRKARCKVSSDTTFEHLVVSNSGQEIDYYERSNLTNKYQNVREAWIEALNVLDADSNNSVFEFLIPANLLGETAQQPMWFLAMKIPKDEKR